MEEVMEDDIIEMLHGVEFYPEARLRIFKEVVRMKQDMDCLLKEWGMPKIRTMFTGPIKKECGGQIVLADTTSERCRNAFQVGGLAHLVEALYLNNFETAERLRQTKMGVIKQLISRDAFFRPQNTVAEQKASSEQDDVALFDLLSLPPEMIGHIMQRSTYQDAQSLAVSCTTANDIYRNSTTTMLLPDVSMVLDFSTGELVVRWWLARDSQNPELDPDFHAGKVLDQSFSNNKKKSQLLNNTTLLKVVNTGDYEPGHCEALANFMSARCFRRVVVRGVEYTENLKMMVEMFDKNCVEIEVERLTEQFLEFPDIKTITIRETLDEHLGEHLFSAKQFINITCGLTDMDIVRKALFQWDNEEREIGHWVLLKPFTLFQTPFGKRSRPDTANRKGYLQFISELDDSIMQHGEVTEYLFHEIQ